MLRLPPATRICELCSRSASSCTYTVNITRKLICGRGDGGRVTGSLPQFSASSRTYTVNVTDKLIHGRGDGFLPQFSNGSRRIGIPTLSVMSTGGSSQSYCSRFGIPLLSNVVLSAQCRRFGTSETRWDEENTKDVSQDLSQDPQIKEWMKEMHRDFEREKRLIEEKNDGVTEQGSTQNEGKKPEGIHRDHKNISLAQGSQTHSPRQQQQSEEREGNKDKGIQPGVTSDSNFSSSTSITSEAPIQSPVKAWAQFTTQKYERFDPRASQIIYDYDEERLRREQGLEEEKQEVEKEKVIMKRGERGVFDVEELVDLLREENARDVAVIQVPPDMMYVEFLVLVSGRSKRHVEALAQLVRRAYLSKKHSKDPPLFLEGRGTDWVALDMRNIALHIMTREYREHYDLETLWTVGSEYDDKCQEPEKEDSDLLGLGTISNNPLAGLSSVRTSSTPPAQG
ncbi:hypothetical protein Pmani_029803 [Petrolisthes manimaculis]|uniref:Mitochondrial assembly of ribosomal large subunit protein 1 n=1 Tax=Petrolisthes manimaculis TaxID=1843537 RepID=A0AAE1TWL2_9EUCA|nr:hypothetical protein Pmani_029803 [Petrolisthes manimaculis]